MSNSASAIRYQAPGGASDCNEADLRTALRLVPILPAPSSVGDLLARLDDAAIDSSRVLADIILDARYPDLPAPPCQSQKPYELSPPFFEPISRPANSNLITPALSHAFWLFSIAVVAAALLMVWISLAIPGAGRGSWAGLVGPSPGPMLSQVAHLPELDAARQERAPQPVDAAESDWIVDGMPDTHQPESEAYGWWIHPPEAGESPETAPTGDSPSADVTDASRDEPDRADEVQMVPDRVPSNPKAAKTAIAFPAPPPRPNPRTSIPFAGTWAASPAACSSRMQRKGHLLTYVDAQRARAGRTTCLFVNTTERAGSWQIAASCSNGQTTWTSNVQLSFKGSQLIWASQKGSTTYVRCPPV